MSNNIPARQDWDFSELGINYNDEFDLDKLCSQYTSYILLKTQRMFKYTGLPKTIPQDDLELLIQCRGSATIAKTDKGLYALQTGFGGTPNPYYRPTWSVVANAPLNFFKTLIIDEDCVVIRNDPLYIGLLRLIKKSSYLLAQADISFKFASINSRIPGIVKAPDDPTKESVDLFFEQIEKGKKLSAIVSDGFDEEGINVYDYAAKSTSPRDLIELKQYILGTFYQELGIKSPFNMKREAINEAEAAMSEDVLYPLIDTMLYERKKGIDKVNKMFGTNIIVELDSVWNDTRYQRKLSEDLQKSEIDKNLDDSKLEDKNNEEEHN